MLVGVKRFCYELVHDTIFFLLSPSTSRIQEADCEQPNQLPLHWDWGHKRLSTLDLNIHKVWMEGGLRAIRGSSWVSTLLIWLRRALGHLRCRAKNGMCSLDIFFINLVIEGRIKWTKNKNGISIHKLTLIICI